LPSQTPMITCEIMNLFDQKGWILSSAFDNSPSVDKDGLALNNYAPDNVIEFELAKRLS
jgi:hypothetical protein